MNLATVSKIAILGLTILLLAACHTLGGGIVIGTNGHHGHAHYHGHRGHLHSYWYYPDVEVYFDSSAGVYYYFEHTRWYSVKTLPRHYSGRLGKRVAIQTEEGSKPYLHHKEHRQKYRRSKHWRDDDDYKRRGHPGRGRGKWDD